MCDKSYNSTAKPCDSCTASPAAIFCRADSAFLCTTCDAAIHSANSLASRHARVRVCQVCEQVAAAVTCKADAAALCLACDADIHSANLLARRHERLPLLPFYEEEVEAASWLLPDPNSKFVEGSGYEAAEHLLSDMDPDPYPDLDVMSKEQKHYSSDQSDGVVPVQAHKKYGSGQYPDLKPCMYEFT